MGDAAATGSEARMIAIDEARALVLAECGRLEVERVPAARAPGRVLAEDLCAQVALPPFDNAAMDGFALACDGTHLPAGGVWEVAGVQAAGDACAHAVHGAWRIMTGAALPPGTDTVVPVEQVDVLARGGGGEPERIRLTADAARGQHVRRAGEDVGPGMRVLDAGTRVGAVEQMLLAALGVSTVAVRRAPRVALISTGRELVDDPAQPLAPGRIRNSNGPYLAEEFRTRDADIVLQATIADDPAHYAEALRQAMALGCDLVISTGAVSMGEFDFVPAALDALQARIVFHKVRIRPGKPLLFAVLPTGALFFGLPGNPVSAAVGLRFFVDPALRAMRDQPPERPLRVPLAVDVRKKVGLCHLQRARLAADAQGRLGVRPLPGQESFRILPLARANAWAVLPEAADVLAAGTMVEVYGQAPGTWRLVEEGCDI